MFVVPFYIMRLQKMAAKNVLELDGVGSSSPSRIDLTSTLEPIAPTSGSVEMASFFLSSEEESSAPFVAVEFFAQNVMNIAEQPKTSQELSLIDD
jgi:hypothetical protein